MNYGEIKAAVQFYGTRADATEGITYTLPVVEQRIYRGEVTTPALRISPMLKTGTSFTLPADWLEMHRVKSGKYRLDYRSYSDFSDISELSGIPYAYSINNNALAIAPSPTSPTVEYSYYGKFPTPVLDADTNWLTINAPQVYISAFLIELARRSGDDAMLLKEVQNYNSTVTALMGSDQAAQLSGSTLRRPYGVLRGR